MLSDRESIFGSGNDSGFVSKIRPLYNPEIFSPLEESFGLALSQMSKKLNLYKSLNPIESIA
jgi:hypothetical protein